MRNRGLILIPATGEEREFDLFVKTSEFLEKLQRDLLLKAVKESNADRP